MTPAADVTVLVPAAGSGERMGMGAKAPLELNGRPVVEWVARKAMAIASGVIVACPPGAHPVMGADCRWQRIDGCPTRQHSVRLLAHAAWTPWVIVWDAGPAVHLGRAGAGGSGCRAGHAVATVQGDPRNLKLTTSDDWALAQTLLDRLA